MTDQENLQSLKAPWEHKSGLLINIGGQAILREIALEQSKSTYSRRDFDDLDQKDAKLKNLIREFRKIYD